MKVAVTGANGFVGARVARVLLASGDDVHAIVRAGSDRQRLSGLGELRIVEADLTQEPGRRAIADLGVEACIHTAWCAEPGKYLSSMANFDLLAATLALGRCLSEAGCRRFVGTGTCFEYDMSRGLLSEETPLAPAHLYSAAKAAAFLALDQLGALTAMRVAWARLFYLYGPDEHPARLVPSIARALLRGEEARTTAGRQVRDFLHVDDAASALCALAHADVGGAVNVASGHPVTVADMAREIASICGRADLLRLGALPYGPGDPMFVCADTRRLAASTGWVPGWSLHDGLVDAVRWWRQST